MNLTLYVKTKDKLFKTNWVQRLRQDITEAKEGGVVIVPNENIKKLGEQMLIGSEKKVTFHIADNPDKAPF